MQENFTKYLKDIDVVLIGGGAFPSESALRGLDLKSVDIICVDRGLDYALNLDLPIKTVLGDFDSVKSDLERIKKDKSILFYDFPVDKDFTDMELALNYAYKEGYRKPLILAATGTRADHSISNIFLLKSFLKKGLFASILDDHNLIQCHDRNIKIKACRSYISLLATDDETLLNLYNVKWELKKHKMKFGSSLTVSNEFLNTDVTLEILKGSVFLILSID